MSLQDAIRRFLPDESRFFDLLQDIADNLRTAGKIFFDLSSAQDLEHIRQLARSMKTHELMGDELARSMHDLLDETSVTPIDREDLQYLAYTLEDSLDGLESRPSRLALFGAQPPTESRSGLIGLIVKALELVSQAVNLLQTMRDSDQIESHVKRLDR